MRQDTLFDKVWDLHKVSSLPGGSDQIFIGLHLIHEVTSPQAFGALKDKNLKVKFPNRTVATVDHIVPTDNQSRPFKDNLAENMIEALEKNCQKHKIRFFNILALTRQFGALARRVLKTSHFVSSPKLRRLAKTTKMKNTFLTGAYNSSSS